MPRARYKQLVDTLAEAIRAGTLRAGHRLPAHRTLAAKHGLALATASRVYAELQAMGLAVGEPGRGTFVREISLPPNLGVDQHEVHDDLVDLNFNYPSLPEQGELLRTALRRLAVAGDLDALLRYQPHGGRPHEREIVARHLSHRGISPSPGNVLIVDGAQHGLAVTAMALLKPGDVVAVDALTYPGFNVLARSLSLELVAVPADGDGLDTAALSRLCRTRRVRAVYVQPTVHNPLGWVMTKERRGELGKLAQRHGLAVIEDAPYAFLEKHPPPPVAALAPESTVYVSGLSKSIATGLRVGFVVAPGHWVAGIERAIRATTWNTAGVMTAIACGWISDGTALRMESRKRQDAQRRQRIASHVLQGLDVVSHPSSYFLWLRMPPEVRADAVARALMENRISVSTAQPFSTTAHPPHAVRIALGSVDPATLRESLTCLRSVVESFG